MLGRLVGWASRSQLPFNPIQVEDVCGGSVRSGIIRSVVKPHHYLRRRRSLPGKSQIPLTLNFSMREMEQMTSSFQCGCGKSVKPLHLLSAWHIVGVPKLQPAGS